MAEIQPAHYTQGACHTAQGDRQVLSSLVCAEGVHDVAGGGLLVDPGSTGLSVDVALGAAFIDGDSTSTQGMYHVFNDASVNIVLTASDPTDDRIDLIVARVYDAQYAGALDEWHLEDVTGTPSPAPVAPAIPDNSIVLAEVLVEAGDTVVAPANITDTRTEYELCEASTKVMGLREVVVFTTSGSFVKANYPWARAVRVKVQAGGGGGGGVPNPGGGLCATGGGGGGGGYAEEFLDIDALGASVTVTVGAGGPGSGATGTGTTGGSSQFGTFCSATGGTGGTSGVAIAPPSTSGGLGGTGGTGTGGDMNITGEHGWTGWGMNTSRVALGPGGGSYMSAGGLSFEHIRGVGASAGTDGNDYGGGGGGAGSTPVAGNASGGAGADGIVIVEVYG